MIALWETMFYAVHNWGEKTPRTAFDTPPSEEKFPIMSDSNILQRTEGIQVFNSENSKSNVGPSINESIIKSLKSIRDKYDDLC